MRDLQYETQLLCREIFKLSSNLKKNHSEEEILFTSLLISIYNTIESIFILLENERYWDVLILERSVFEGMLRLIKLNSETPEVNEKNFNEFFYLLPEFENIKRYNRAKIVNTNKDNKIKQIVDIECGLKEIVKETSSNYSKKERKEIERKWSVSELCKNIDGLGIENFDILLFFYNISSNFIHKDATSLGIQTEKTFNYDELYYYGLNATASLNMIHCLSISVDFFGKFFKKEMNTDILNLINKHDSLLNKLNLLYSEWLEKEYK